MNTVKMNKGVISSKTVILIFLICNPLVEFIYGTFTVNAGSENVLNINRMLRFIAMFVMLIDIKNRKSFKRLFYIALIFVISYIGVIAANVQFNMGTDISYLLKIYMGFVVYYYFHEKLLTGELTENEVYKSLVYASIISSVVIVLSFFGFGFLTYSGDRFGFRGLFAAANLPTVYLLMTLPIAFAFKETNSLAAINAIILSCIALPLLGTKTGVFGTIMLFIIIGINSAHGKMNKKTLAFLLCGLLIIGCVLIYVVSEYIPYLIKLFSSHSFYHNSIYSFIISNRDTQVILAKQYFDGLSGAKKILVFLFGSGYSRIENTLHSVYSNYYAVEMDFYALFFCCGAAVLGFVLYRLLYAIKFSLVNWKCTKLQEDFYLLLALFIMIIHAYFGGHTLTDSMGIFPAYIIMAIISVRHVKLKNRIVENRMVSK